MKAKFEIGYSFERDHYNMVKVLCKLHFSANFTSDCAIILPIAINYQVRLERTCPIC